MDSPLLPENLNDEIDRKALTSIVQRFRRHHALRYQQSGRRMPAKQRAVLQALPLLYHWNHPALPGFVSHATPAGLACYEPTPEALLALQQFTRSFRAPRFESAGGDVQAVFIMGSGGSVGQTRSSDIDLWVCCGRLLHQRLWPKVRAIDAWARDIGLDLHTFLVDPDMLRTEGHLPGAHAPTLLLDEFYRSAVLLAGRYPLWWLVPDDDPAAYAGSAHRLLHYRFVPRDQVLDFGPVPPFPDDELAHAAAAELRRCLRTPEKSLLKLKLIEAYAAPRAATLSSEYRRRVHAGEDDPARLDPYLMLYGRLEAWCRERGDETTLDLIRRLLVSKTADNVRFLDPHSPTAPGVTLGRLFSSWGFSSAEINHLRAPQTWSIDERKARSDAMLDAMREGLTLIEELMQRARAGRSFSRRPGQRQLGWLNRNRLRHLHSAIDRLDAARPGEIPRLHPAMTAAAFTVPAPLRRTPSGWALGHREAPAYVSSRLTDTIVWAELNRVRLTPVPGVRRHLRAMAQIRGALRSGDAHAEAIHVFVNAEPPVASSSVPGPGQPPGAPGEPSLRLLSQQTDPLDYSGLHQLHLRCFDVVRRGPEGRWHSAAYPGGEHLVDALASLFTLAPTALRWHVIGGQEAAVVRRRLLELQRWGHQALRDPGGVFVMPFGAENLLLLREQDGITARCFRGLEELPSLLESIKHLSLSFDPASRRFAGQRRTG